VEAVFGAFTAIPAWVEIGFEISAEEGMLEAANENEETAASRLSIPGPLPDCGLLSAAGWLIPAIAIAASLVGSTSCCGIPFGVIAGGTKSLFTVLLLSDGGWLAVKATFGVSLVGTTAGIGIAL